METKQRFLRRIYLLNIMDHILKEARYHKDNDEAEALPGKQIWKWDDEEGMVYVGDEDDSPE